MSNSYVGMACISSNKGETKMTNKINWTDIALLCMGVYVPYYWWLRNIRREYIKGKITRDDALMLCGLEKEKQK